MTLASKANLPLQIVFHQDLTQKIPLFIYRGHDHYHIIYFFPRNQNMWEASKCIIPSYLSFLTNTLASPKMFLFYSPSNPSFSSCFFLSFLLGFSLLLKDKLLVYKTDIFPRPGLDWPIPSHLILPFCFSWFFFVQWCSFFNISLLKYGPIYFFP